MPEHLRALVFIMTMAVAGFAVAKAPLTAMAMDKADYRRRRNLWIATTACAFLAHDFWIFAFFYSALLFWKRGQERNSLALFLLLAVALPRIPVTIPGFGFANSLFDVDHVRLLSLILLLPTWLRLTRSGAPQLGSLLADKILIVHLLTDVVLTINHRTLTSVVRDSVLYAVTDVLLPYLVASRSMMSLRAFRDCAATLVMGSAVLSLVLMFEMLRGWLLYNPLDHALNVARSGGGAYVYRGGSLRAEGSIGHPIAAGFVVATALSLYQYLVMWIPRPRQRLMGAAVLALGLIGALSRAPWLQAAMALVIFRLMSPTAVRDLLRLAGAALAAVLFLVATGRSDTVLQYLPWVGTIDSAAVEGRETLWDTSVEVFLDNPIFGRFDYIDDPRIQALRGGDGLIDITNTYAQVGLKLGAFGLVSFVLFFVVILIDLAAVLRRWRRMGREENILGRALLATLLGVVFLIATCSSYLIVPILYWSVGGICVGFTLMVRGRRAARAGRPIARRPAAPAGRRPAPAPASGLGARP